jgi:nucleoside-diphosphate-sugar epimerase
MAGSCAEYDWRYGFCSEFITPCIPHTTYGRCKKILSDGLAAYSEQVNLSSAWGRIFFLYGPNEHPSRLIPSVINSLFSGELARCTHGNQWRDFMHVRDVASAFVHLLNSDVCGPVNIASGIPVTIRDVVNVVANKLNSIEKVEFGVLEAPQNDPPFLVADNRRLKNEVRWEPEFNLFAGIVDTIEHKLTGKSRG